MPTTATRRARRARNITAKAAAKRLGYSVDYLLRLERTGQWPEHRADEVAAFYGLRVDDLLPKPGRGSGSREARTPARRGIAPGRPRWIQERETTPTRPDGEERP